MLGKEARGAVMFQLIPKVFTVIEVRAWAAQVFPHQTLANCGAHIVHLGMSHWSSFWLLSFSEGKLEYHRMTGFFCIMNTVKIL